MSVNEKMTAIADVIRHYTRETRRLTLDDMPREIGMVNLSGYNSGWTEGRDAERSAFWGALQNYGNEKGSVYYYAFTYNQYNDDTYNPQYDIICSTGTRPGQCLFFNNTVITDTKVPITVIGNSALSMFSGASSLVTIRKLTINENTELTTMFRECTSLVNLTMGGTIGQNGFDIHWSENLNTASIVSIIEALSDEESLSELSVTLSQTAVNKMIFPFTSEKTGETYNSWSALESTKGNWNISLM